MKDPLMALMHMAKILDRERVMVELVGAIAEILEHEVRAALERESLPDVVIALMTPRTLQIDLEKKGAMNVSLQLIAEAFFRVKASVLRERALCEKCTEPLTEQELRWKTGLCVSCMPWERMPIHRAVIDRRGKKDDTKRS